MSLLLIAFLLAMTAAGAFAILYIVRLSTISADGAGISPSRAGRYRPMLRLLSEDDLAPVKSNKKLVRRIRAERASIFRGYVRCLSRDYARVLSGLSLSAVHSATDRPDLAVAILRSRLTFAAALCRLDAMVVLYRFGVCGVDASGLVEALDALFAIRSASPAPAAFAA